MKKNEEETLAELMESTAKAVWKALVEMERLLKVAKEKEGTPT